ncbi:hypothetical protein [Pandoraea sp. SD6-2]|uniref:hypothetical protein n=1 Tax=Pandoraea sp. SD6-2 TaxID=1286093 RepID=UPI001FEEC76A|nr:hypothetical protein [Pandoraea sp. SD6-2]
MSNVPLARSPAFDAAQFPQTSYRGFVDEVRRQTGTVQFPKDGDASIEHLTHDFQR